MFEKLLAKRHIASLDLDPIRLKVMELHNWDSEKASQVELEYRRFLYALAHKRPEDSISPPTSDVDEFWHQHILNTRKYRQDCDKVFGHYIDHTPGLSSEEQIKADTRRRDVYADFDIDSIDFDSSGGGSSQDFGTEPDHHSHTNHIFDGGHHGDGHAGFGHDGDGGGHSGGDASSGDGGGDGGGGDGGGCGGGCSGGGCGG